VEFFNFTNFPAMCFAHRNEHGELNDIVVLGVAFDIADDGNLAVADPQPPINFMEMPFPADALESGTPQPRQHPLRRESDLAPHKPKVDVIVNATAYAPGGRAARSFHAGVKIFQSNDDGSRGAAVLSSFVVATGPRHWRYRSIVGRAARRLISMTATLGLWKPSPWRLDRPAPVKSVPVRYDMAYGGVALFHDDRDSPTATPPQVTCPENPVGRGFVPNILDICEHTGCDKRTARRWFRRWATKRSVQAPQLQWPSQPLPSHPGTAYPLVGWGTVPKHWVPRLDHAGTFDDRWEHERHPLLPEDFNPLYWNGAHPAMQLDRLDTNAHIELHGLTPSIGSAPSVMGINLPGHDFAIEFQDAYQLEPATLDLTLDTVLIDLASNRLTLLYRTRLEALDDCGYIQLNPKEPSDERT
jgi:hypothetical protein